MTKFLCALTRPVAWLLIALGAASSAPCFAWGSAGHRTVCEIALVNLTPAARQEVDRLLAARPPSLQGDPRNAEFASACTYPDRPVANGPGRRDADHFVNYARNLGEVTLQSGCGDAYECVDAAIIRDFAVLRSPVMPDSLRSIALMYLGHFVGDIHQPLHNSFLDDRGGNSINATGQCTSSLHSAWDTCILVKGVYGNIAEPTSTAVHSLAASWSASVTDSERAHWLSAAPWQWSRESFAIATSPSVGYCVMVGSTCQYDQARPVFTGTAPRAVPVDAQYQAMAMPIIQQRITQGGIRLAHLLNLALDPAYRFGL